MCNPKFVFQVAQLQAQLAALTAERERKAAEKKEKEADEYMQERVLSRRRIHHGAAG